MTILTSTSTNRRRRHILGRLRLASAGLAITAGMALGSLGFVPSADAATFGEYSVVASGSSDCTDHTVVIWPMTTEPLDGNFSISSYAQVKDRETGTWITSGWLVDNGIQGHVFYNMRDFDPYAKVTYARFMNGSWEYRSDWVKIEPTLDSIGVFCELS